MTTQFTQLLITAVKHLTPQQVSSQLPIQSVLNVTLLAICHYIVKLVSYYGNIELPINIIAAVTGGIVQNIQCYIARLHHFCYKITLSQASGKHTFLLNHLIIRPNFFICLLVGKIQKAMKEQAKKSKKNLIPDQKFYLLMKQGMWWNLKIHYKVTHI